MYAEIAESVLKKYGIQWKSIGSVQKGYRNESYKVVQSNGSAINLFFYKSEADILKKIASADNASRILNMAHLPVRVRADERLLRVKQHTYAAVYNYLPGNTISWESYTMRHIKLLGWAMGDVHYAWSKSYESLPPVTAILQNQLSKMELYFSDSNVIRAAQDKVKITIRYRKLARYREIFSYCNSLAHQHILHMDMVRGNVLFDTVEVTGKTWQIDDTVITGIIDFEKAAHGHPIFDVARTLAFLLVDCPKPSKKVFQYFLESGYNKRSKSHLTLTDPLQPLITYFLMYDLYKFMCHTPYESLNQNHHYIRTRDLLVKYGMISIENK